MTDTRRFVQGQEYYELMNQWREELREELRAHRALLEKILEDQHKSDNMSVRQEGRLQSVEMYILKHERLLDGSDGEPGIRQNVATFIAWHMTGRKIAVSILIMIFASFLYTVLNYKQETYALKQENYALKLRIEKIEQHMPTSITP